MPRKKKSRKKRPSTEQTATITRGGRAFNIPTINPRTGQKQTLSSAIRRAENERLLGFGFPDIPSAVRSAKARSAGIPTRDVDRSIAARSKPFNPGGKPPRDIVRATLIVDPLPKQKRRPSSRRPRFDGAR